MEAQPAKSKRADLLKVRLPLSLVIASMSLAATSGGAWAVANAKVEATTEKVIAAEHRIETLEKGSQENQVHIERIQTLLESASKAIERIERKLDQQ